MKKVLLTTLVLVLALGLALRMATPALASPSDVTLNPVGAGDSTTLALVHGGILPVELRTNWGVNTADDGDSSCVRSNAAAYNTDLYQVGDVTDFAILGGNIESVTVYIKVRGEASGTQAGARTAIKTHDTVYYGAEESLTTSYLDKSTTYTENPNTLASWEWDEINALEIGVALRRTGGPPPGGTPVTASRCTLVWVVVEYTSDLTGQFRTQTQGGWGTGASGNNPGAYRDANFADAFPSGLVIGDSGGDSATFTTAAAIEAFLPATGTPGTLGDDYSDPTATNAGVLAGQVLALTLNVGFDLYDPDFSASTTNLKDLVIVDAESPCCGWTVEQVLQEANNVLAGFSSLLTPSQINDCVSAINENFVDGDTDGGFLGLP